MEVLILQNKNIHNVKLKGDNFQIKLKIIQNPAFYIIRYQKYNDQPYDYDYISEMFIVSYKDIMVLCDTLDLTHTGCKKLKKWVTKNIPYINYYKGH